MEENDIQNPVCGRVIFHDAMKNGLILGGFTVACLLLVRILMPKADGTASTALGMTFLPFILGTARTVGCIWLMVNFAKKMVATYDSVRLSHTFRLNMFTGLFSGAITATYAIFEYKFISHGEISSALNSMVATSDNPALMEETIGAIMPLMPFIIFLATLAKCFLIGLLAGLIISRFIPGRQSNPFQ